MVDRTVSELLIDQGHPSRIGESVIISPDCTRVAYVARAGRKQLVVVDGREANYYDAVERRSLIFCSDSKRLAFVARAEKRRFVVVNGREQKRFDKIEKGSLVFSPDGQRLAYVARAEKKRFVVLNDQEQKRFDKIEKGSLVFSPDSQRLAYVARAGKMWVVVDGQTQYDTMEESSLVFSPDSRRLAYVARAEKKQFVVVNGREQKHYDWIEKGSLVFSPDSQRLAYVAGEKALAAYAYEEALAHFERGLEAKGVLLEGADSPPDAEAAALLFGLGRAKLAALGPAVSQQGVEDLGRAFDFYDKTGDAASAVAVAEFPLPSWVQGRTKSAHYISRALSLVPPDSRSAARLLASYGLELGRLECNYDGAQEAFNRALAIADRENDLALRLRALASATEVDLIHLQLQDTLDKADEVIKLSRRIDDPPSLWLAHLNSCRALLMFAGFNPAQVHASAAEGIADKLGDRSRRVSALRANAHLYRHAGYWQRAREFTDLGLALEPHDLSPLIDLVIMEYETGDFDRGAGYLEQFLEAYHSSGPVRSVVNTVPAFIIPWVARFTGTRDRLDVAEESAEAFLSSPFFNPTYGLFCTVGLAWVAVVRKDASLASKQYQALKVLPPFVSAHYLSTSRDHLLGLLSNTMGQLDQASEHFEHGVAGSRKASYRPELAWTCCDYADTLLQRNNPDDREKAIS